MLVLPTVNDILLGFVDPEVESISSAVSLISSLALGT